MVKSLLKSYIHTFSSLSRMNSKIGQEVSMRPTDRFLLRNPVLLDVPSLGGLQGL
jgi:hypothetical protein